MELSRMSIGELNNLQGKINAELKMREQQEVARARDEINAIAKKIGMPLKDIIGSHRQGKATPKAARYRHPSNASLNWSGRGRQPNWVKDWVASGHPMDELRINHG